MLGLGFNAMGRVMKRQAGLKYIGSIVRGVNKLVLSGDALKRDRQDAHIKWMAKNMLAPKEKPSIDATGLGLFQLLDAIDRAATEMENALEAAGLRCEDVELPHVHIHGRKFVIRPTIKDIRQLIAWAEERAKRGGEADGVVHLESLLTWGQALEPVLSAAELLKQQQK